MIRQLPHFFGSGFFARQISRIEHCHLDCTNNGDTTLYVDITGLCSLGFDLRYIHDYTLRDTLDYWRNHV
jgi:hypothetical protein